MKEDIDKFISYMRDVKKIAKNTEVSYERDLKKLARFLEEQQITGVEEVSATSLNSYILYLEKQQLAPATVSRNIASIKAFFDYLFHQHRISEDPSELLKAPRVEKKVPEILSVDEMERLLLQPSDCTDKGMRDKAMLELLYATGIRVTELISLKMTDLNLQMEYIVCRDMRKERVIPFGKKTRDALASYLGGARASLLGETDGDVLFPNCSGQCMSRQGFWKLIKQYAKKAGIEKEITPHTLRHSFAAHLVENGADLHCVQEMLGHADVSTTQMYAMVYHGGNMREVYAKAHPRG